MEAGQLRFGEHKLHLVNPETGEIVGADPKTQVVALEEQLAEAQSEKRHWAGKYHALKRLTDRQAPKSKLWPAAITLFHEWKFATGKVKSRWSADRFWLCEPYLKADGFVVCRWAVYGIAYEPMRKTLPSGLEEVYTDWELCFRNRATFERYARRGWANPEAREQFPEAVRFT